MLIKFPLRKKLLCNLPPLSPVVSHRQRLEVNDHISLESDCVETGW